MVLKELSRVEYRLFHCQNWTKPFENNVCTCFISSAKRANYSLPHILCNESGYASVTFAVTAGSRTSGRGSTWGASSPSNTSGLGRMTRPTIFLRCLGFSPSCKLSLLSLHVAVLPGNYWLETTVSPQHLAAVGSFRIHRSPGFLDHL